MNPPGAEIREKFVAIAFSDFDGIGFEFYSTVGLPCFEKLREKKEDAQWGFRLGRTKIFTQEEVGVPVHMQRVSITIAKGNSRVLDCMRHDWQSATAPA
jgi:hypothetical protein